MFAFMLLHRSEVLFFYLWQNSFTLENQTNWYVNLFYFGLFCLLFYFELGFGSAVDTQG